MIKTWDRYFCRFDLDCHPRGTRGWEDDWGEKLKQDNEKKEDEITFEKSHFEKSPCKFPFKKPKAKTPRFESLYMNCFY